MARARNIKPSLFKNEILGEADPLLTILFIGLWSLADRLGRLEDRPKRIKAEIFPYRECPDFNGYLTELASMRFIDRYEVGGCRYIQIINFTKHQSPHKTEKASELPAKPVVAGVTCKAPLNNGSVTEEAALIPDLLIPDSLYKPADKSAYVYEGETIRITATDYKKLEAQYPLIDLDYQLSQLDLELRGKKKWFVELNSKLNYRNKTPAHHKQSSSKEYAL